MEKGAFDRHDIDHVDANQGRAETARKMKGIGLRGAGMFGSVDADQNSFDHRPGLRSVIRDSMASAAVSREPVQAAPEYSGRSWYRRQ
jgi:hypothetical protein